MSETAQIILAVCFGSVILAAAFTLIVMAIDTMRDWKNDKAR